MLGILKKYSPSTKRVEHQEDRDAAELAGAEEDALSAVEAAPDAVEPVDVDLGERGEEEPVEPADVDLEEAGIGRRRQQQELTGRPAAADVALDKTLYS